MSKFLGSEELLENDNNVQSMNQKHMSLENEPLGRERRNGNHSRTLGLWGAHGFAGVKYPQAARFLPSIPCQDLGL